MTTHARQEAAVPTIDRITLYVGRMPCDLRFSYGRVQAFPYAAAEIHAGPWTGVGECLHPEAGACAALGRSLLGQDPLRLDQLIPRIEFDWQRSVHRELFSMALHDLGLVDFDEPFTRLFNQGIVTAGGKKMSKRSGGAAQRRGK